MRTEIINTDFTNALNDREFVVATLEEFFDIENQYNACPYTPHRLTFFAIIFYMDGSGYHHIDFTDLAYDGMSIFFVCKGQLHAFDNNKNKNGYILYFTEEFVNRNLEGFNDKLYYQLFNYALNSPQLPVFNNNTMREDFVSLFKLMHHEFTRQDDVLKDEIIKCQLRTILYYSERMQAKNSDFINNHKNHALFIRLQKLVDQNIFKYRTSQHYCDQLNVGYRKLNAICKEFTSGTIRNFIDERLILEIKRLLANSDFSIKEICYKTGFDEPTNMTKFFKCHTGTVPKLFRASFE